MDREKIEQAFAQFRNTTQNTFQSIDELISKMQNVAQSGNVQAQKWMQDIQNVTDTLHEGPEHANSLFQRAQDIMNMFSKNDTPQMEGEAPETSIADKLPKETPECVSNFLKSDLGKSLESSSMGQKVRDFLCSFIGKYLKK